MPPDAPAADHKPPFKPFLIERRTAALQTRPPGLVLHAVSVASGYPLDELLAHSGWHSELSRARHLAFWLLRRDGCSLPMIGRRFNGRDHSMIFYGCQRVAASIAAGDGRYEPLLSQVMALLEAPSQMPPKPRPQRRATGRAAGFVGGRSDAGLRPITASTIERARDMRRFGGTLAGTAKVLGVDPLRLAIALGERVRNDLSAAIETDNTEATAS